MDLDRDGQRDILSGSYSRMQNDMAGLFQILRGQPDGTFRPAAVLNGTDGQPLIIPLNGREMTENICTRPFAVDWDGDGHLDLVVGTFAGTFYLFKGDKDGKFPPVPTEIHAGDTPIKLNGYHGDPFVIDWDGDGDLDLLSGSAEGGVQWAENRAGGKATPRLEPFRWLIPAGKPREYGQILRDEDLHAPTGNTRIWVDDVNNDGKLDILVGDNTTLVAPVAGMSDADHRQKFADWQKAHQAASAELSKPADDVAKQEERQKRAQELYQKRKEFMKEDSTGFVWLYLQK